jgi:oxygen-independent coproporphyrinogen-3 oxidase
MNTPLALADRHIPRYTSYPTAPHFSPAVDAATYAAWLAALPADARLSLYLHVPFCTKLCLYCGCSTKAVRRLDPVDAYATLLQKEIDLVGQAIPRRRVVHLHWGGGTPSILDEARLVKIKDMIEAAFDLSDLREHAIELDPRTTTRALARGLVRIGINRASFGVQDFAPHVQRAIGRIQPFELVEEAISLLRTAGIRRINIDLMYGLPRQSVGDVIRSAELAALLRPDRIALFGYAHVPWLKPHQRLIDEAALPSLADRLSQLRAGAETLAECGYVPIGLDHFALPGDDLSVGERTGRLHRNFQGYTTDAADALIGLGASSIGRLPQGFVQNAPDVGGYGRAVDAGQLATVKGFALRPDDRLRGAVIERLMCDLVVDLDAELQAAKARDGGPLTEDFGAEITSLSGFANADLIAIDGRRITVTEAGRPFVRLVAATFDSYLRPNVQRHSIAV